MLVTFLAACPPALAMDEDEKWEIVWNTVIHILHHEIGHALIDQFDIPVIGQEEDAVDAFATVAILETYDEPQSILIDSAASWFAMADEAAAAGTDPDYFGVHDLDIQRAYRIICVAHGYDPGTFAEAAKEVELPEDRLETCVDDADQAVTSWDALLTEAYRTQDGAGGNVTLAVAETSEFASIKERLDTNGMATEIAQWMDETYDWPAPITISFDKCGVENAFYDPSNVKVTMCYEFMAYLRALSDTIAE